MKVMLNCCTVIETVEPYWTTNYHFKDVFRDIVCPIFRHDLPFERWLGLWCRYLSNKVFSTSYFNRDVL